MINELLISKHPVFKCWNILQTGVFIGRTKGGGAGTHFKNEPENHLMLVHMTLACDHIYLFFFSTKTVRIGTSILDFSQEEVTASAHHEPQVCAVGGVATCLLS